MKKSKRKRKELQTILGRPITQFRNQLPYMSGLGANVTPEKAPNEEFMDAQNGNKTTAGEPASASFTPPRNVVPFPAPPPGVTVIHPPVAYKCNNLMKALSKTGRIIDNASILQELERYQEGQADIKKAIPSQNTHSVCFM